MEKSLYSETKKMFQIEEINTSQAERLSRLARKIYPQHYTHLWHDAGEWYNQMSFEPKKLESELENPNSRFFIAQDLEGNDLGFLKINLLTPLSKNSFSEAVFANLSFYEGEELLDNALELERIYLLKQAQGLGLGMELTNLTFKIAAELERDCVWLKVMDSSMRPIAFYEKMGFKECGCMDLLFDGLVDGMRGMYVMKKDLRLGQAAMTFNGGLQNSSTNGSQNS